MLWESLNNPHWISSVGGLIVIDYYFLPSKVQLLLLGMNGILNKLENVYIV